jgi:prepilin-type N-terminal cleavage/methylation domain-containing protein
MRSQNHANRPGNSGFTLIELLTVIGIIAILASLLMVVIPQVVTRAKARKARLEMAQITAAIESYESRHGHFPVAPATAGLSTPPNPDLTYGGIFQTPTGPLSIGTVVSGSVIQNDQLVAVLMNFATYPNTTTPSVNANSQANPEKTDYLNAPMSGDTSSPGVGTDLVYRDPWGHPYVISLDLNDDGLCEDAFYKLPAISGGGLTGLILQTDGNYAFHGRIMVWSAGPDGKLNSGSPANRDENKDNLLNWY